jgi:hypothetical protein
MEIKMSHRFLYALASALLVPMSAIAFDAASTDGVVVDPGETVTYSKYENIGLCRDITNLVDDPLLVSGNQLKEYNSFLSASPYSVKLEMGCLPVGNARYYTSDNTGFSDVFFGEGFGRAVAITPEADRVAVSSHSRIQVFDLDSDGYYKFHSQIKWSPSGIHQTGDYVSSISNDGEWIFTTDMVNNVFKAFHWDGSDWERELKVDLEDINTKDDEAEGWMDFNPEGDFAIAYDIYPDWKQWGTSSYPFIIKYIVSQTNVRAYARNGTSWSHADLFLPYDMTDPTNPVLRSYSRIAWLPDDTFILPVYYPDDDQTHLELYSYDVDDPAAVAKIGSLPVVDGRIGRMAVNSAGTHLAMLMDDEKLKVFENIDGSWTQTGSSDGKLSTRDDDDLWIYSRYFLPSGLEITDDGSEIIAINKNETGSLVLSDPDADGLWTVQETLTPTDYGFQKAGSLDLYANSIAISGDGSVVVQTDTDDDAFDGKLFSGSFYVFTRGDL